MRKWFLLRALLLSGCLIAGVSCSKRERSDPNAEEWSDIKPLADDAKVVPAPNSSGMMDNVDVSSSEDVEDFSGFAKRLEEMKSIERAPGQTLLTGNTLTFDYASRYVRMDGNVQVDDDHGKLKSQSIIGRFSDENKVEHIEAHDGVEIVSEGRKASAEKAVYDYAHNTVQMDGHARVSEGVNSLSGERIWFWIKGNRKLLCEPNAVLVVAGKSELGLEGVPEEFGDTEIRANQIIYDESKRQADLIGHVRVRNQQVAMNCGEVQLFLKEDNEIDWIEAHKEVIIQSDGRKALADKATYEADEGKFTLEGHPMVKQGRNVMTGDRIIFWHATRAVLCEPNGRVLYYYDLDKKTQAKFPEFLND